MELCPNCKTPYPTKQQAFECCMDVEGAKIDLTYGNTKQDFVRSVMQMQQQMGTDAVTSKQFEDMITPKQYAQFLWQTYKRYGPLTDSQLEQRINVFLRSLVMQRLYNKGIVEMTSVNQHGSVVYKPKKKVYWGRLNNMQKKVLESFGGKITPIYKKKS